MKLLKGFVLFSVLATLGLLAQRASPSGAAAEAGGAPRPIPFIAHRLGADHAEGCAIVDMNGDGRLDITSGANWYENPGQIGPAWKIHRFREAEVDGDYIQDNTEFVVDANHDGAPDIVSAGWESHGIWWFENPRKPGKLFHKYTIVDSEFTEGMVQADVDGDGKADIIAAHFRPSGIVWIRFAGPKPMAHHVGGEEGDGHGVGVADLDGDGKPDILTVHGWYKGIDAARDQWEWHPDWDLDETGFPIIGYDVNNDGKMDFIYGKGHSYGLYWMEQVEENGKRAWKRHVIDESYSQVHALALADLDGDGQPELIAGKRFRAHNTKDPGALDPIVLYYYKIDRSSATFTRFPLSYNGAAGVGTMIHVVDLDGDGDMDVVVAGKTGLHWLENLTINKVPPEARETEWQRASPWPPPDEK